MASRGKSAEPSRSAPRLYLVTPRGLDGLATRLAEALEAADVAAVLLRMPDLDERGRINHTKSLVPTVQASGAALLVDGSADIAVRAGADGAHLTGIAAFDDALAALKPDRIAGCGGLHTRHDAMVAGERGADYVMFGEPDARGHRPGFDAIADRVEWWAHLFEIPCVAFAGAAEEIELLAAAGADFVALGEWIFGDARGCAAAVADAARRLSLAEPVPGAFP
jgi:thiamine-phosphate pyrophosphorylase